MPQMKTFVAAAGADGNNTVLAGVAGKQIVVVRMDLSITHATTPGAYEIQVWSAATAMKWRGYLNTTGQPFSARGSHIEPVLVTNTGEGVLVVNPASVDTNIACTYYEKSP